MEIKEEKKGSICKDCNSEDIVWSMSFKKMVCRDCSSDKIVPIIKRWVAGDDLVKMLDVASHFKYSSCALKYIKEELNSLTPELEKKE